MESPNKQVAVVMAGLLFAVVAQAQEPSRQSALGSASEARPGQSETIIPRLVKFSGTLLDAQQRPLAGPVGVTFALYAQQTSGAALWMETQNVKPDANGSYTVLLGAASANGLPTELFVSGEARWLGIQVGQQPEHERILLVSVPYAVKAGDAETLGGLPASAFVTTGTPASTGHAGGTAQRTSTQTQTTQKGTTTPQPATPCTRVTSDGAAAVNSVAVFTTACNVQSSVITQSGTNVGIGTATPAVAVDVVGNNAGLRLSGTGTHQVTVTGASSGRLGQDATGFFFSSDTNGKVIKFLTNNGTLNEWMRITSAGNVGIGTQTPAAKLDVAGTGNFTGTTTASATAIFAATQGGSSPAAFAFTPATVPPAAVAGIATATSGSVAGVGGIAFSPNSVGVGGANFSSVAGTGVYGFSAATSGNGFGIWGQVASANGLAGAFSNDGGGNLIAGQTGPMGARVIQFRVDGSGNFLTLGNAFFATPGNGIILKSPNGSICKLLGIDNTGTETFTTVTCPPAP